MIYFDNAASSWPKPKSVAEAMQEAVQDYAANPGRGGHKLALQASRTIFKTRALLAQLFEIKDPTNIIFFQNATGALNQAIKGFRWKQGDHIISTSYEHNSVRRPLEFLKREYGVRITYVQPLGSEQQNQELIHQNITGATKLIVATHVSNLTGLILPIKEIGAVARQNEIPFLVDASQSAGILPINVEEMNIDLLAFPGHKGLLGPQGTGGLYVSPHIDLIPLLHGGTGSQSEEIDQPLVRPDRYESGTVNTPGIAGLGAGLQYILSIGIENIKKHEEALTAYALQRLKDISGITIYGTENDSRIGVIPINLKHVDASELSYILDQQYNIATRAGMHCTPLGHQTIKTTETGAVRISFGYFNTKEEIDKLIIALQEINQAFG